MVDVQLAGQSITASGTSGTTAPASGTTETWAVSTLGSGIPSLVGADTYAIYDPTLGQSSEIIRVTALTAGGTSITVTRGADGTTPVAHASGTTFPIVLVPSAVAGGELAYAENATGTTTVVAANTANPGTIIPSTTIVIPPSTRPVYLSAGAQVTIPSAGTSSTNATLCFVETSNGTDTPLTFYHFLPLVNIPAGIASQLLIPPRRLGPTARTRTFNVYVGSGNQAVTVVNGSGGYTTIPTFAYAEAR